MMAVNSGGRGTSNLEERKKSNQKDLLLVERAQAGDMEAFRQLVERHQRRVFAVAVAVVRNEHDARDVAQEAFLRVYRNLDRFKKDSSFFTWLYRIVHNLSIDHLRKPARREIPDDPQQDPTLPWVAHATDADPYEALNRKEIAARLREAIGSLPPYHRSVIVLREIQGMSYQEIAGALDISKGTVMSRLFHARKKLQQALVECHREQVALATMTGSRQSEPAIKSCKDQSP